MKAGNNASKRRKGLSIQWRIMARLLPLLVLLFTVVLYGLGQHLKGVLYSHHLEIAKRSSLMVIHEIMEMMVVDGGHRDWDRVVEHLPNREDTDVEIVDAHGVVIYSFEPGRRGTVHSLNEPECGVCHKDRTTVPSTEAVLLKAPDHALFQVFVAPLNNEARCRTCHTEDVQKLGMVFVRQNMGPVHRQVKRVQLGLTVAGGLVLILTLVATRLLLGRYVGRSLRKLTAGAEAIGAGDLGHSIEMSERNEFAILADTLNASADRLAETILKLERQRDDFETLYGLVDQLSRSIRPETRRRRVVELTTRILDTECILIRAPFYGHSAPFEGIITYRGTGREIFDIPFSGDPERDGIAVPDFYSQELVEHWMEDDADDMAEMRGNGTIGYPLWRHGVKLGLILVPAPLSDNGSESVETCCDPHILQTLCKHLAIALEFSGTQQEFIEQERLAAIGETVAGLVHCVKNVLNGLRAGQYVVDRALEKQDMDKFQTGWRVMKNSVRRVESITSDMLYYVKDRPLKREPVNPNDIILEVIDLLREHATAQGVRIRTELDETIDEEMLDRMLLYRAMLNLVNNAIDACIESESGDLVIIGSLAAPDEISLVVEDNGIGMSEAVMANLFRRFFSTKTSKGTGLGLAVVKKIVEEHGGTIQVESESGRGASFHIRIPRRGGG